MTLNRNHPDSWTPLAEQAGSPAVTLAVYPLRL